MDLIPDECGGNKYVINGNMVDLQNVGAAYVENGVVHSLETNGSVKEGDKNGTQENSNAGESFRETRSNL